MSKRETIDLIRRRNPSASAEFLATFQTDDLLAYLHQLQEVERDRHFPEPERTEERSLVACV